MQSIQISVLFCCHAVILQLNVIKSRIQISRMSAKFIICQPDFLIHAKSG